MTLPPDAPFVILVSLPLLVILVLAFYYALRSRHKPVHLRESIYHCTECGHVYALARNRPMDRCPKCGHLNDAVRP